VCRENGNLLRKLVLLNDFLLIVRVITRSDFDSSPFLHKIWWYLLNLSNTCFSSTHLKCYKTKKKKGERKRKINKNFSISTPVPHRVSYIQKINWFSTILKDDSNNSIFFFSLLDYVEKRIWISWRNEIKHNNIITKLLSTGLRLVQNQQDIVRFPYTSVLAEMNYSTHIKK
jgi:hypothetical protein